MFHRIFAFVERHPDPDGLGIDIIELPKPLNGMRKALEDIVGPDPMMRPMLHVTVGRVSGVRPPTKERFHALVRNMRDGHYEALGRLTIPANGNLAEAAYLIDGAWDAANTELKAQADEPVAFRTPGRR